MWPFNRKNSEKKIASVSIGEIVATWSRDGWTFSDGEYDFTMYENDNFDQLIVDKLPNARKWVAELQNEINSIIDKHVGDWGLEADDRTVVAIDVSRLADENQIDVAYGCDQWADYGFNIVITDGKITESYGGD